MDQEFEVRNPELQNEEPVKQSQGFDDIPQPAPQPNPQPAPQPNPQPVHQPVQPPVQPPVNPYFQARPVYPNPQPYYSAPQQPAPSQPVQPMPQYQPSQYRWVNPNLQTPQKPVESSEQPTEQPVPEKKPKKGKGKKALCIILAIVIALGCALAGGVVGALIMDELNDDRLDNFPIGSAPSGDGTTVYEGEREPAAIDINKIDTSKIMTAAEVYALNVNSTVGITTSITTNYWGYSTTSAAAGSGFVYSTDGYIVTNYHVVEDSDSITVSFYDGSTTKAELVGYDENNDVAVLKVETKNLTPVVLGDSGDLNVGDSVVAIGNPLGELTFSLTAGTVSAVDREVTFSGGITMNLIQTDCAINSGNSGGALFNLYGEVIGVTNAKYSGNSSSGATIDNIGFAIPMNHVRPIVDSIIQHGYVITPYIGVSVADVSDEALGYGTPEGASIQGVVKDGPAAQAGLQTSDIVTHINGTAISGAADLKKFVTNSKPGDVLKLTVYRKGETVELTLTVGQKTSTEEKQEEPQQVIPQIPGWFPFG